MRFNGWVVFNAQTPELMVLLVLLVILVTFVALAVVIVKGMRNR